LFFWLFFVIFIRNISIIISVVDKSTTIIQIGFLIRIIMEHKIMKRFERKYGKDKINDNAKI